MSFADTTRRILPRGRPLADGEWQGRHRVVLAVLWVHVAGLPVFGIIRGYGVKHSLFEGLIVLAPTIVAQLRAPRRVRTTAAVLGLLLSSAVLVHMAGGAIEAHFHYFVMIGLVLLYQDWLPFLLYIGFVLFQHWLIGAIDPGSVYNHPAGMAHPLRWALIHAGFIGAASVIGLVVWRRNEELRDRAEGYYRDLYEGERAIAKVKEELVTTVSHEFRTPLTAILGFVRLAETEGISGEDRREYMRIIEERTWQLARMVDQLLTMSQIEAGRLPAQPRPVALDATMSDLDPILQSLDVKVRGAAGIRLMADPDYLHHILANLLENARKYGAAPYTIEALCDGPWVEVRVRDAGPGVPEYLVPQLFERFTQGEMAAPQREGFGLGLSIVREMILALGGEIRYEPNVPTGACFVVRLPPAAGEASHGALAPVTVP